MISVAQCIFDLSRAGAQRVCSQLVFLRDRARFRMTVYAFNDGALGTELRLAGEEVQILPQRLPYFDPSLPLRLARAFQRDRINIVHTHLFGADLHAGIAARLLAGIPVVATVHSDRYENWRQRRSAGALLGAFQCVVAVGDRVRENLTSAWPALTAKVKVIPNGVQDPGEVAVLRERSRSQLHLSPDELVIGAAGRLSREKGHLDLLEAFATVLRREPRARLVILGEGPLRARLEGFCSKAGFGDFVKMPGHLPNSSLLIAGFDLYVISSLWEGLPLSLLEAMVAGLPCVATDVGGLGEAVKDRQTGRLVPPGRTDLLAEAILELLESPDQRRVLGQAARDLASQRYSAATMLSAYQELYEDVHRGQGQGTLS